jgi:drug/metabolite transporter (DMT)-like permease
LNYAIALGSVTIVNALIATEYVFIVIFGLLFSLWQPKIFAESGAFWDVAQKVAAIFIISAGVLLISK